jgi:hypothetical protein
MLTHGVYEFFIALGRDFVPKIILCPKKKISGDGQAFLAEF